VPVLLIPYCNGTGNVKNYVTLVTGSGIWKKTILYSRFCGSKRSRNPDRYTSKYSNKSNTIPVPLLDFDCLTIATWMRVTEWESPCPPGAPVSSAVAAAVHMAADARPEPGTVTAEVGLAGYQHTSAPAILHRFQLNMSKNKSISWSADTAAVHMAADAHPEPGTVTAEVGLAGYPHTSAPAILHT
jgi:hypothetical protein